MAALIGYFSSHPVLRQVPGGMAQIKLSFRHGGVRLEDCRRLTPSEIAKLPPNERRPNTCSRERVPLAVRIDLDGRPIYEASLEPTGLSRDGPSETYEKFLVPAGWHDFSAMLRDSKRTDGGFDYRTDTRIELKPLQNLAVDFKADQGGFILR
jgi:hypothetical protein